MAHNIENSQVNQNNVQYPQCKWASVAFCIEHEPINFDYELLISCRKKMNNDSCLCHTQSSSYAQHKHTPNTINNWVNKGLPLVPFNNAVYEYSTVNKHRFSGNLLSRGQPVSSSPFRIFFFLLLFFSRQYSSSMNAFDVHSSNSTAWQIFKSRRYHKQRKWRDNTQNIIKRSIIFHSQLLFLCYEYWFFFFFSWLPLQLLFDWMVRDSMSTHTHFDSQNNIQRSGIMCTMGCY